MARTNSTCRTILLIGGLLALGACAAAPVTERAEPEAGIPEEVMIQLGAMAAPYQDLRSVELRPETGCYWYLHAGPVETTMLPLRTVDGRQICLQAAPPAMS